MTSSVTGHRFRHELFLYRSAEELVEFVVPLARDGLAAEEPTLLLLRADAARAVRHEVGPSPLLAVEPALAEPGRSDEHVRTASTLLPSYSRVVHQEPVIDPSQWYTTSFDAAPDRSVTRWLPPDGSGLATVAVYSQAGATTVLIRYHHGGPSTHCS